MVQTSSCPACGANSQGLCTKCTKQWNNYLHNQGKCPCGYSHHSGLVWYKSTLLCLNCVAAYEDNTDKIKAYKAKTEQDRRTKISKRLTRLKNIPTKDELNGLLNLSYRQIAGVYDVSPNTVLRWIKKYGLPRNPPGWRKNDLH